MKYGSRRTILVTVLVSTILLGFALAQDELSLAGQIQDWQRGEAQVLVLPGGLPPTLENALAVGDVAADGSFSLTLPESVAEERFLSIAQALGSDPCDDLSVTPEDARFVPIVVAVYGSEGPMGQLFWTNPEPEARYEIRLGYAPDAATVRGTCRPSDRPVVEDYDFTFEPGWNQIVQRGTEDPNNPGVRIDRWRNEPIPEDATWLFGEVP